MHLFALAQAVPNPETDFIAFAKVVIEAIQSRNYFLLASLAVIVIVWGLRKFAGARLPFLRTDIGGIVLSLLASLGTTLAAAFLAGTPFGVPLLLQALGVALSASGAFVYVKKLFGLGGGSGGSLPRYVRGYQVQNVAAVFQAPFNDTDLYVCTALSENGERFLVCDELHRVVERKQREEKPAAPAPTGEISASR